ncbi:MAG: hypothetical protein AB7O97_20455 [Planctomycetota bacterium]
MKKQLKDALHRYKVEAFKISHHGMEVEDVSKEILDHTGEALENAYHFHFHKDPNPARVETYQMVKKFVLEALLPPVVEKMMRRITALEKQQQQMIVLLDELMEALSEDEPKARAAN